MQPAAASPERFRALPAGSAAFAASALSLLPGFHPAMSQEYPCAYRHSAGAIPQSKPVTAGEAEGRSKHRPPDRNFIQARQRIRQGNRGCAHQYCGERNADRLRQSHSAEDSRSATASRDPSRRSQCQADSELALTARLRAPAADLPGSRRRSAGSDRLPPAAYSAMAVPSVPSLLSMSGSSRANAVRLWPYMLG